MQIAGNRCLVCDQNIGLMRDGTGCVSCQIVVHKACVENQNCPKCGRPFLPTEQVHATGRPQFVGIGGWLLLPAVGFVLGPIMGTVGLVRAVSQFSNAAVQGHGGLYILELCVQAGLLIFMIYAATRLYGKKANAPSTIVAFMVASLIATAVLLVIELSAGANAFAVVSGQQLARGLIPAAIWIPYFRVSKRVKATFVN
jgi:hypothetical protein